jgi:NAD(P)-dependent dehydrogenase (short-subunit alcohol dehydrogenase family)
MMNNRLDDKIVWITGAANGIGRALAIGFAQRGAIIVATDYAEDKSGLKEELKAINDKSLFLKQDVTLPEDAERVSAEILKRFGKLDILINNAGIDPRKPADEITNEDWAQVIDTNLNGAWFTSRAAIPLMKQAKYGKIIQLGSITAHIGFKQLTHYMSSKMGLEGMTRGLARDLGVYGIRVNCLVLGAVKVDKEIEMGNPQEIEDFVNKHQCIAGRILPEDVESVFAFFASSDSDAITGQSVHVDLGWTHG